MYFIAIDLGATYIKSCLINSSTLEISDVVRERFPGFNCSPAVGSHREIDFSIIIAAVRSLLVTQLSKTKRCSGILFSNQMHGLVMANSHGEITSPFISWQDQRSAKLVDLIKNRMEGFDWVSETGEYARIGFPVMNLFALAASGQAVQNYIPLDLGSAIVTQLVESKAARVDPTNAAASGCFDIRNGKWHKDLIRALGLQNFKWPEIVPSNSVHGYITYEKAKIPVYMSVGDQQISLLGAGVSKPGQVSINIATGSQVSTLSTHIVQGDFQTRPYFDDLLLQTITHIPAGRALNALVELFVELSPGIDFESVWATINAKMEVTSDSNLEVDLSFFPSSFGEAGAIRGIVEKNLTVGSIMRAAMKNIAKNHRSGFDRLLPEQPMAELIGSGGIIKKNKVLQKYVSSLFECPLTLSPNLEDALFGHAQRIKQIEART